MNRLLLLQSVPSPHNGLAAEAAPRGMPPTTTGGVPSSYAYNNHVPGHAPQPVHSISTAPAMITEGRVRALCFPPRATKGSVTLFQTL